MILNLRRLKGCCAKNPALLQNKCKRSQLGKLINLITGKMVHKGKNYRIYTKVRTIVSNCGNIISAPQPHITTLYFLFILLYLSYEIFATEPN